MRRTAALATLVAVVGVAVPALPASACSPAPAILDVSRNAVPAGESVTVSGDDYVATPSCGGWPQPPSPTAEPTAEPTGEPTVEPTASETPTAQPTVTPSETPEPTATVSETVSESAAPETTQTSAAPVVMRVAPAFRPPYAAPGLPVVISLTPIGSETDWRDTGPAFEIARAESVLTKVDNHPVRAFTATVTIPSSVAPGHYVMTAREPGSYYGTARVEVLAALPATGSSQIGSLARLGALLVLGGAVAVAAGRARAHRA